MPWYTAEYTQVGSSGVYQSCLYAMNRKQAAKFTTQRGLGERHLCVRRSPAYTPPSLLLQGVDIPGTAGREFGITAGRLFHAACFTAHLYANSHKLSMTRSDLINKMISDVGILHDLAHFLNDDLHDYVENRVQSDLTEDLKKIRGCPHRGATVLRLAYGQMQRLVKRFRRIELAIPGYWGPEFSAVDDIETLTSGRPSRSR